jgi:hypothetical protein
MSPINVIGGDVVDPVDNDNDDDGDVDNDDNND